MQATPTGVTLDEVTATAAGQTVRGAAQIAGLGGRGPTSRRRSNSEKIDVAALFGPPPPLFSPEWRMERKAVFEPRRRARSISICGCRREVSTSTGHELADAAASAILKNGVLNASLVDGVAYGGRLKGEIRLECVDESLRVDGPGRAHGRGFRRGFQGFRLARTDGKGKRRVRRSDRRSLAGGGGGRARRVGDPETGAGQRRGRQPRAGPSPQPAPADRHRARPAGRRDDFRPAVARTRARKRRRPCRQRRSRRPGGRGRPAGRDRPRRPKLEACASTPRRHGREWRRGPSGPRHRGAVVEADNSRDRRGERRSGRRRSSQPDAPLRDSARAGDRAPSSDLSGPSDRAAPSRFVSRAARDAGDTAPEPARDRSAASLRDADAGEVPSRRRCTVVPPVSRETSRIGVGVATRSVIPVTQAICRKVSTGRSKGAVI